MSRFSPTRLTSTAPTSSPRTGFLSYVIHSTPSFDVAYPTLRFDVGDFGTSFTGASGGKSFRPSYHILNSPPSWMTEGRPTDRESHSPSFPASTATPLDSHFLPSSETARQIRSTTSFSVRV